MGRWQTLAPGLPPDCNQSSLTPAILVGPASGTIYGRGPEPNET